MKTMKRLFAAALIACSTWTTVLAAPRYDVISLGTLGGAQSWAFGLNDLGQVVGRSETGYGQDAAFLYQNGQMGFVSETSNLYSANAISNTGRIVGVAVGANGYVYDKTEGVAILGALTTGGITLPADVNDSGQVVGNSDALPGRPSNPLSFSVYHAFVFENGDLRDLDAGSRFYSSAYAINNAGTIVGTKYSGAYGFIYSNASFEEIANFTPEDINNAGQVVGRTYTQSGYSAALYDNGEMRALGTLGGASAMATAINDTGTIVGVSLIPSGSERAFVYDGTSMHDINDLIDPTTGWTLTRADGINIHGQVIATGFHSTMPSVSRSLLLNPVSPIPEPSIYAMLLPGLLVLSAAKSLRAKARQRRA